MAKLSSRNSYENQSQMALPSLYKRGCDKALWLRMGWGTLLFPFILNFSSFHLNLFSDPTSAWPRPDTTKGRDRIWFNGFWIMRCRTEKYNSLCTPTRAKSVSYFHCVKRGILGIGMVHGFGPDWVDGRSIAWLEWVRKGVLHGSPWENHLTFELWHPTIPLLLFGFKTMKSSGWALVTNRGML